MKPAPPKKAEVVMYEWEDTGEGGPLKIRIDLREQKAQYFRGGKQVGWSLVSTGREGHSTPAGHYKITEKMPLSHGCIRLPKDFVAKLYEVTQVGTPVQIVRGG